MNSFFKFGMTLHAGMYRRSGGKLGGNMRGSKVMREIPVVLLHPGK